MVHEARCMFEIKSVRMHFRFSTERMLPSGSKALSGKDEGGRRLRLDSKCLELSAIFLRAPTQAAIPSCFMMKPQPKFLPERCSNSKSNPAVDPTVPI